MTSTRRRCSASGRSAATHDWHCRCSPRWSAATTSTPTVTICQTTGWAHGLPVSGAKIVYAHNTPRWLYQRAEYLANLPRWYGWGLTPLHHRSSVGPVRRLIADVVLAGSAVARAASGALGS